MPFDEIIQFAKLNAASFGIIYNQTNNSSQKTNRSIVAKIRRELKKIIRKWFKFSLVSPTNAFHDIVKDVLYF